MGEDGTADMTEETSHALANARLSLAHSFFMSHAPQRVGLDFALAFGGVSAGGRDRCSLGKLLKHQQVY